MQRTCRRCLSSASRLIRPIVIKKAAKETTESSELRSAFVDFALVRCQSGAGGHGGISMRRVANNPRAGPDGGDGGNGGHVIFEASKKVTSLGHIPSRLTAHLGRQGRPQYGHQPCADHLVVPVPIGTVIYDLENLANGSNDDTLLEPVAQMIENEQIFISARGGQGGRGNKSFATSLSNKPQFAQAGGPAEQRSYALELKLLAHAALVAFPNAGKSTLLQGISRARPKIASYPFTTLNPHVGMIKYDDMGIISVADIPGIVPSDHAMASTLSQRFLRHIERCMCLVYVIDITLGDLHLQWTSLRETLQEHKKDMIDIPSIVLVNKCDLALKADNLDEDLEHLRRYIGDENIKVMPISAREQKGLVDFLVHLRSICDSMDREEWLTSRNMVQLPANHEYVNAARAFLNLQARRDHNPRAVIYEEQLQKTAVDVGLEDEHISNISPHKPSQTKPL